jgi:hypothetical protein
VKTVNHGPLNRDAFHVCLDARPDNVSLLRRLLGQHLRAAGVAAATAQRAQASVVRQFAEMVSRLYPERVQVEVEIEHDPDPHAVVRERR